MKTASTSSTKPKTPKTILTRHEKWFSLVAIVGIFFALYYDNAILKFIASTRIYPLDAFMLFMTDFGLLYSIIVFGLYLLLRKKYHDFALMLLTAGIALEVSYLIKVIFQTPRPFAAADVAVIPLTQASGFSMPSLHTAFCFSVWPYLKRIFPNHNPTSHLGNLVPTLLRLLGYSTIILIAFSRLYLGVHYASDLIAGGLLGYIVAKTWIYFEEKYKVLEWFIFHVKDKFELRRQVAHLLIGCAIVFLLKLQLLNAEILLAILILGGILSIISKIHRFPLLDKILRYFERPGDLKYFPGKGSFFLVLGSLLAVLIFKHDIALAAIVIMAVGDSVTTIVGTYFGKIKNPLNPRKHLEGTAIAIIASTLAAFFFVDFPTAFWGAVVGMVLESILGGFINRVIDDNLLIPLAAGFIMTWLS